MNFFNIIILAIVNCSAISVGVLLAWSAVAGPEITADGTVIKINSSTFAFVVAMMPLGGAITSIFIGYLRNKVGTRLILVASSLVLIAGWIFIILATSAWMLLFGRFLNGAAAAAACNIVPLYIGEIAAIDVRGTLLSTFQLSVAIGTLLVFVLGYFWNLLVINLIFGGIAVLQTIGSIFIPESPSFLVGKAKIDRAEESLRKLRGKNIDLQDEMKILQLENSQMQEKLSFREVFTEKATQKASIIVFGMWFFFQLTGINAILFYTVDIFEAAMINIDSKIATIIVGALPVLGVLMSGGLLEKFGRKVLLLVGLTAMTLSLLTLGIYFHLQNIDPTYVINIKFVPILSLGVFVTFFSIGIGPIAYVLHGEMFSSPAKVYAAAFGQVINFFLAFVLAIAFVKLRQTVGDGPTFYFFAVIAILSVLFVKMFVVETKGKTLMEIQEMLKF